jgi:hypothetical protein
MERTPPRASITVCSSGLAILASATRRSRRLLSSVIAARS